MSRREPMYGWALTDDGKPIPISEAERGGIYYCPLTKTRMIAKKGDIKQHHFAHEEVIELTPENVARAVAGIWITQQLQAKLSEGEPVTVTWHTKDSSEAHTINILKGVAAVIQDTDKEFGVGDVVLQGEDGKPKVLVLLGLNKPPLTQDQLHTWTQRGTTIIKLNPEGVRGGQMDLEQLLAQSVVVGGWWLMDESEMPEGVIINGKKIREVLAEAVYRAPHVFYGQMETIGNLSNVLNVFGKKLWLPRDMWEEVIGGSRNRLGMGVEVIIQEWAYPSGIKIELFYVTMNQSAAVAVRRYEPHEQVVIRLETSQFRLVRTTALDLAKQFAGGSMQLPL